MKDNYGRTIDYMRISVTQRCNLNCSYCKDKETDTGEVLSKEEILELVKAGVRLGITHYRITGGEPTLHADLLPIIAGIRQINGVESVGITTNGLLLESMAQDLAEAGVDKVNVSLDTADEQDYEALCGRQGVNCVIRGIRAVVAAGITCRLNTVVTKDTDFVRMVQLADSLGVDIRFIEMMPIGKGTTFAGVEVSEGIRALERVYGQAFLLPKRKDDVGPAVYYSFPGISVRVGMIGALSGCFCETCNRIRVLSDGRIKGCLYYDTKFRLPEDFADYEAALKQAVLTKPKEHKFKETDPEAETACMNRIGG